MKRFAAAAFFLVVLFGCSWMLDFTEQEPEDNDEQKYKVEVDYMGTPTWSIDQHALAPRLDYLGTHVTAHGIAVVETLSEAGTIDLQSHFANPDDALILCYNHWDRCPGGAIRHSFHILGADEAFPTHVFEYTDTDILSVMRRSVVFTGNIRLYLENHGLLTVARRNLSNSYCSLHGVGLQMMYDRADEHPIDYYDKCVMCIINVQTLVDVPAFCEVCWATIESEEESGTSWVPEIKCSTLLLADARPSAPVSWSSRTPTCSEDPEPDLNVGSRAWRLRTRPASEFVDIPDTAGGLRLLLNVPEDTLLVGQPILAEVWLTNVSDHDVFDQLLLESVDRRLRVYAVCPGVGVLDLDPGRRRTMISPGYFRIQPGGSARTLTAIGNLDISARTRSTGFVAPQQFFDSPGWYRLFATYDRGVPGPRCRGDGETLRIMSSVDSFFVRLPSGVDALVYEAALADLEETDLGALERTCEENPSSVYTPYLLAIRAHRLRYDSGRSDRFIRSAEALEHLVKTYPDHILRELVEFDMALYMGIGGQAGRANSRLEKLMVMYPGNPMAYIRFAPDGSSKSLEDLTIRGGQNESGTALE